MTTNRRYAVRVGIFAFATAALFAIVLVTFAGLKFWGHHRRYYVEVEGSVIGLTRGAPVYFDGIDVGNVHEIAISPEDLGHVRVAIDVDLDAPVRVDTKATVNSTGLTGIKVIDLRGGAVTAAPLPENSVLESERTGLDRLQKQAERIAEQTQELMTRINTIVSNVEAFMSSDELGSIVGNVRTTTQNLARASRTIDDIIASNRGAIRDVIGSVSRASDNANAVATDLRALVRINQSVIAQALADIRQGARNFKELTREVREQPSRLVFTGGNPQDRKLP